MSEMNTSISKSKEQKQVIIDKKITNILGKRMLIGFMSIFFYVFGVDKFLMDFKAQGKKALKTSIISLIVVQITSFIYGISLGMSKNGNPINLFFFVNLIVLLAVYALFVVREIFGIVNGIKILTMKEDDLKKYLQEKCEFNYTDKYYEFDVLEKETDKTPIVQMRDVQIGFFNRNEYYPVVKDLNLDIYQGEILGLVGESGSGKTTIGRAIMRIIPSQGGVITYRGERISGKLSGKEKKNLKKKVQMIFQDPSACLNDRSNVDYIVSEGIRAFHMYDNEKDRLEKVTNAIREVGLRTEHLSRFPHEFSGGQRQRIGIARSVIMNPELVIADEPISALDVSIRAQVLNLIRKFQQEKNMTVLFIAHDLSVVKYISDRIAVIYHGRIVEVAPANRLFEAPLHPYTKSLLTAIPLPDPRLEKNKEIIVYDDSIHDYSVDLPEFVEIEKGHFVYANKKESEEYKKVLENL